MKLVMPVALAIAAAGMALPVAAQTGYDAGSRTQQIDRCSHLTDPGLRSQCVSQSYSGGNRLLGTPNAPATAPLVPTTPNQPDIVPGQQPRR